MKGPHGFSPVLHRAGCVSSAEDETKAVVLRTHVCDGIDDLRFVREECGRTGMRKGCPSKLSFRDTGMLQSSSSPVRQRAPRGSISHHALGLDYHTLRSTRP